MFWWCLELFDMKTRYEESDNLVVRATRTVTDKMSELFGRLQHCLTFNAASYCFCSGNIALVLTVFYIVGITGMWHKVVFTYAIIVHINIGGFSEFCYFAHPLPSRKWCKVL